MGAGTHTLRAFSTRGAAGLAGVEVTPSSGQVRSSGTVDCEAATALTSAQAKHGGHETTIAALFKVFAHWRSIVLPLGYTGARTFETGTPCGATWVSGHLGLARQQGRRLTRVTSAMAAHSRALAAAAQPAG